MIGRAVEAYKTHKAWHQNVAALRPGYTHVPTPTASDVLDDELTRLGIVDRNERDHWWCVWADLVIDEAEDKPWQPPRRNPTKKRD